MHVSVKANVGSNGAARLASLREIPALDLAALVQRHAAGFGRVRACGDWSERRFRQFAGPVLLAFARHAHLLPVGGAEAPGSLLDAGLDACAQSVLAEAACGTHASRVERQEAVVLRVLSHWTYHAVGQWRVSTCQGRPIALAGRPLADQLHEAASGARRAPDAPSYRVEAVAQAACASAASMPLDTAVAGAQVFGLVLLLRAAPPSALALSCVPAPPLIGRPDIRPDMRPDTRPDAQLNVPRIAQLIEYALQPATTTRQMQGVPPREPAPASPVSTPAPPVSLREAMHALVAEGRWKLNVRRARLWHLDGRLYLAWKTASTELAERLSRDPAEVIAALLRHGIVLPGPGFATHAGNDPGGAILAIRTPHTESLPVVELSDADAWLDAVATAARVSGARAAPVAGTEPAPHCT